MRFPPYPYPPALAARSFIAAEWARRPRNDCHTPLRHKGEYADLRFSASCGRSVGDCDSTEVGDKIVTDGGMAAKAIDLTEDTVTAESRPNKTTFVILRSSVAQNRTRRSIAENERKPVKEQNKAKFTHLFKFP